MCLCAALCLASVGNISSQVSNDQPPFLDAGASASPRLTRLTAEIRSRSRVTALASFWEEIRRDGAPLIEPIPGESNYSWVTFLWRAVGKTTNVVVVDGVAAGVGGADPTKSLMSPVAGTDVWYRTYKVRNDAAFTYTLSPNDSLEKLTGPRKSKPQLDPLNPNLSGPQSSVRLSSAPAQTENAAALAGTIAPSSITSTLLQNTRNLQIYTPPGYTAGERYRGLRVSMSVGSMEIPEQRDTNRRLGDVLAEKGYLLDYSEFNGNHSYLNWRADLARHLVHLIGPPR